MTKLNWILFGASLLILLVVLARRISRHSAGEQQNGHRVTAETYKLPDTDHYGYVIKIDGSAVMNQPYLPIFQGKAPFASQEDAQKTGDCLARRIALKPHELPALTVHDLDSLHVKHP